MYKGQALTLYLLGLIFTGVSISLLTKNSAWTGFVMGIGLISLALIGYLDGLVRK